MSEFHPDTIEALRAYRDALAGKLRRTDSDITEREEQLDTARAERAVLHAQVTDMHVLLASVEPPQHPHVTAAPGETVGGDA
jgi:SMC interacting uncharacterized protein involved in chromosome segregation